MADDKGQTTVSLVVECDLLEKVDKRVAALDLNRSQYFRRLAREDLMRVKLAKQTPEPVKEAA